LIANAFPDCFRRRPKANHQGVALEAGQVLLIGNQSAAGGDHRVFVPAQLRYDGAFALAKGGFAFLCKDFPNRFTGARFDGLIRVEKVETQLVGDEPAHGGFAGAHESDEGKVADLARATHGLELAHGRKLGTKILEINYRLEKAALRVLSLLQSLKPPLTRRLFGILLTATALSLITTDSLRAAGGTSALRPPNIIVILADDLGAECLSSYGSTSYKTPHLDALAESGIRFMNCYATPLCSPSRVQLMTGRYGFRTGWTNMIERGAGATRDFFDPTKERTFGHVLKAAGYATAQAGKWQLCRFQEHPDHVKECGFDESCSWTWLYDGRRTDRYWTPSIWQNGKLRENVNDKYGEDVFCDFLIDFITRHRAEPFFIYYPMVLVHDPFEPTPDELKTGSDDRKERKADVSHFPAMVAYMDKTVGRLIAALDKLKLRENTLVLFTGDNGTPRQITSQLGDNAIPGGKGMVTHVGSHVPLIASWPGTIPAGRVLDDLIDFTDVLPTLADVAGDDLSRGVAMDGRSFLPQLRGGTGQPREWVYVQLGNASFVRDQRWLLHNDGRFYDIKSDPFERKDLSAETKYKGEIARLKKALPGHSAKGERKITVQCVEPDHKAGAALAAVVDDVPLAHTGQFLPLDARGDIVAGDDQQIRVATRNLSTALKTAGTGLENVVKLNVYLKRAEIMSKVQKVFARTFSGPQKPAVSFVVGGLAHPDAVIAMDAVATVPVEFSGSEVKRFRSPALRTVASGAHVAILPAGGRVYVSGQAEKGDLAGATHKTLESLVATLNHLGLKSSQIVQLKAFIQPVSDVAMAQKEIERFFGDELAPPTVFVEWISSGYPVEIELIASAPESRTGETLSFITPPGMKPSPVYSKVARVNRGKTVFVSGLYGSISSDAASQIREIFGNLGKILEQAGSSFDQLAKATYYVSDDETSRKLNEIRPEIYNPERPPAASKAMVSGVGVSGKTVTLDMIAVPE